MHIHNVYFWLKEDLGDKAKLKFAEGLVALTNDPNVESGYAGPPADTGQRDVVDNSYSFGLVLVFQDKAGHDDYQKGAPHRRFLEEHMDKWEKVLVFDIED
jgi:hypothetical protein